MQSLWESGLNMSSDYSCPLTGYYGLQTLSMSVGL